ncbi:MAG TPA: ShlB/FhaC/HecB family hemolysin secretion/activation protein [Pseudolabrys sp.]|nr:ShlB/FhaC/HecB family hemolysin secretion/activation protein [Pseudolabrys sp.]
MRRFVLNIALCAALLLPTSVSWAQNVPSPSQVAPPAIPPGPGIRGRIAIPQVPAGAAIPEQARKLTFRLTGLDIQGEFDELVAARRELSAPLIGRRITVAQLFEFADKLQQIYVRAGYPLARVVILPHEFEGSAHIKLRVIDGFIEEMNLDGIPSPARRRINKVLEPLIGKTHLRQSELERQLLLAGETPGVILNATFAAGKQVGGSVLVLTGRYRPVSASLYIDNAMPRVFGTGQAVVTGSLNSVLGYGEQLTLSAAGLPDKDFTTRYPTRRYLSASLGLPLGVDGWRLDLSGTDGKTTPRVTQNVATQGLLSQAQAKLSYDVVKSRDFVLTAGVAFTATDEKINSLLFDPAIALSLDRTRVLRPSIDGLWRLRATGTTVGFGIGYSRGLPGLGARRAADADPLLPLSRAGADAVFSKLDGRFEITQAIPYDFTVSLGAFGQTSFNVPMLTSQQFDITGARMLSGFTAGALAGDTSWAVRGELARPFAAFNAVITPYLFAATGERIYENPSILEVGSLHAQNYGLGARFLLAPWAAWAPDGYGFVEWSRARTTDGILNGDRIFTGLILRY